MADNSVVQTIKDAEIDARSLSEFIYSPADAMVLRRLAPSIHSLQYYLDFLDTIPSIVQNAIDNTVIENGVVTDSLVVVDGSMTQARVNKGLESIADLSTIKNPKDGLRVYVKSYHAGLGKGGGYFVWDDSKPKSEHDGGYIIDPDVVMPNILNINTYYKSGNSGVGVWVRADESNIINADSYGLVEKSENEAFKLSCAAIQQAIFKASVTSSDKINARLVRVSAGTYQTTNPIILSSIGSYSARLPALIGGSGGSVYDVEIIKTTNNTVGEGYVGGDIDAIIYVSPTTARGSYVYGENTKGFSLTRTNKDTGYGYFAKNSVMGSRGQIQATSNEYNIYTDDCWMSKLGYLRAYKGINGISIRGGTSNFGGPLYADLPAKNGFDFYGLTYSNLDCACDGAGYGNAEGSIAYDFSYAKALHGTFSVERHKGVEFYLHYADGCSAKGRSYHTIPVSTSSQKVNVQGASTFDFINYNWKETFTNSEMTPSEKAKYKFTEKPKYNNVSSINYRNCLFVDDFASSGFLSKVDGKFIGNISSSSGFDAGGLVSYTITLSNSSFKRLCYVGDSVFIEFLSVNCVQANYDRYYSNPPNPDSAKPNRYNVASISKDLSSPTPMLYLYSNGIKGSPTLLAYIDAEGWLCIKSSNAGNSLQYKFVIVM